MNQEREPFLDRHFESIIKPKKIEKSTALFGATATAGAKQQLKSRAGGIETDREDRQGNI